jgi:HNH endonuclease
MITCICGTVFEPPLRKRGEAKRHCSPKCKSRAWRLENPSAFAVADAAQDERRRSQRADHPELFKAREAARYAADPERHRARVAAYRSIPENRAKSNMGTAAWRKANPDKYHEAVRRWEEANPDLVAHYQAGWRARKRGNGGSHTLTEWRDKCAEYGNRCGYCRESKKLSKDHDIPLSRGGTDDIANIIPACRLCNSKKRTRTGDEYRALLEHAS